MKRMITTKSKIPSRLLRMIFIDGKSTTSNRPSCSPDHDLISPEQHPQKPKISRCGLNTDYVQDGNGAGVSQ